MRARHISSAKRPDSRLTLAPDAREILPVVLSHDLHNPLHPQSHRTRRFLSAGLICSPLENRKGNPAIQWSPTCFYTPSEFSCCRILMIKAYGIDEINVKSQAEIPDSIRRNYLYYKGLLHPAKRFLSYPANYRSKWVKWGFLYLLSTSSRTSHLRTESW